MTEYSNADKRGYLDQGFRLFHLKDTLAQKLQPHYHEFDKIILPLGGRVTYVVEGVAYFLKPWDMLLVQHNLIHRVAIDPEEPYERIVIWLGREWMASRSDPGEPLDACFETARRQGFHLLRTDGDRRLFYMQKIQQLEEALRSTEFGAGRMAGIAGSGPAAPKRRGKTGVLRAFLLFLWGWGPFCQVCQRRAAGCGRCGPPS